MKRFLLALFVAVSLVALPYTVVLEFRASATNVPPLPYARYDEVIGVAPEGEVCGGAAMRLSVGRQYVIFSSKDRDIFMHIGPDGEYDFVYFVMGEAQDGRINVKRAVTVEEARRIYPSGPCAYFSEVQV